MGKDKRILSLTLVGIMCMLLLVGCGSNQETAAEKSAGTEVKDDHVVKLGYYNCDHMVGAAIGEAAGIYKEMGLNVEITGNGKIPQAMAAGQMDVGYIGIRGLMSSAAKGAPIFVAANNHTGGSMYLVVANDIKKPEDLIGQPLAIGAKPEKNGWWMEYSKQLNIPSEGKHYQALSFGSDADKYVALKTGQIKGFTCCDPWGSVAEYEGTGKIMATYKSVSGDFGVCCVYAMNKEFRKDHPELAKKMILAHTKSIQYAYLHPLKAAKIFADYYKTTEEVGLMTLYKKLVHEGRTLTWKVDKQEIQKAMDLYMEYGQMDAVPKLDDAVNTDLLEACGADDFDQFIKEKVDPVFPLGMTYEEFKAKAHEIDQQK